MSQQYTSLANDQRQSPEAHGYLDAHIDQLDPHQAQHAFGTRPQTPVLPPVPQTRSTVPPIGRSITPQMPQRPPLTHWTEEFSLYTRLLRHPVARMLGYFVIGTLFATGHHLYYDSKSGQEIRSKEDQAWAVRVGTGLSFFAKCLWGASAAIAHEQWVWLATAREDMTIKSIEAAFESTHSLWGFRNIGTLRKATIASFLSVIAWSIPLTTIITPASLTAELVRLQDREPFLRFHYDQSAFYIAYGVVLIFTIVAVAAGYFAYWTNGNDRIYNFSTMLQITRSPDLDRIAWDRLSDKELGQIRLKLQKGAVDGHNRSKAVFVLSETSISSDFPRRTVVRYG